LLPGITLAEINALAADWFPERNRIVIVSGPEAAGVTLPGQAELAAVVRAAAAKRLAAYVDATAGAALMAGRPRAGTIVKTTPRPEAGVTEWTLSNGATVVLKPTRLKEDQILFRAFAPGGTSLASDADFPSAKVAAALIRAGGVGQLGAVAIDRLLTGKAVNVTPFIADIDQGMRGGSTPQDLETLFQLVYLGFTAPRADPNAFAAMSAQAKAFYDNQSASPDVVFEQTIDAAFGGGSPRRQPETPATVDRWNLQTAFDFYKARFADASNFTFVFVGSFTLDAIRPLVETYVASLPATRAKEAWRDRSVPLPSGVVERTVRKGIDPKSRVAIVFSGAFTYTDKDWLALRTMAMLLQSRLSGAIREELGGTYDISAVPAADKFPRPEFRLRIEWTCDPTRTEALMQRVFQEIAAFQAMRLSPNQMRLVGESLRREFEVSSQDNGYLLVELARRYANGETADLTAIDHLPDQIAALTAADIQQAAQMYLDTRHYVRVTLVPEGK
jgi:zinc protease